MVIHLQQLQGVLVLTEFYLIELIIIFLALQIRMVIIGQLRIIPSSAPNPYLNLNQIDVSGATAFIFSIDMTTRHFNDWDDTDELLITYSIDGGTYQNLMWIQNTEDGSEFNTPAALDIDFDGEGDCSTENTLPALITGSSSSGCNVSSSNFKNIYN